MGRRRFVVRRRVAVLAAAAVLLGSCSSGGSDAGGASGDSGGSASADAGSWTVLVYQIADNNLEPFALQDLTEMASVGSGENLDVVVMSDRSAGEAPGGVLNVDEWDTAKTFEVGQGELTEVSDSGEADMADPATLADFVATGFEDHPADNHAVVLWDHGAGWPGMGPDDSSGDLLTLPEIQQGLTEGMDAAGVEKLDLVGFDACLMATYEVGQAMAPLADYMIASQETEPGIGWDWSALEVLSDGQADAVELGETILADYQAFADSQDLGADITLSLTDLGALDDVEADLAAMTETVAGDIDAYAGLLGQERTQNLSFGRSPDPTQDTGLTDLGQLSEGLGSADEEIAAVAEGVNASLDAAIVDSVAGPATEGASGLSVYFPPSAEHFSPDYAEVEDDTWAPLLDAFYTAGENIPDDEVVAFDESASAGSDATGEYFFDENGLTISGTFAAGNADNLSEAVIYYGLPQEDGSIFYIGEEPGNIYDDGTADATFDLTTLTISDGQDTVDAYLDLGYDADSDTYSIDVPLVYAPPGATAEEEFLDLNLSLVLDSDFNILSETYYEFQEEGTLGEFTADPDGLIYPLVQLQGADGSIEYVVNSDVGLFADIPSLAYDFAPLPSGTPLHVDLTVYDYGGNSSSISAEDVVP